MYRSFFKRGIDIFLAAVSLTVFSPLFLILAILVKISSQGPVFFVQKRGGLNGRYFDMLKFRSMASDKDAEKKGFEPGSKNRITPIGCILRKTKLDELPQLINVLKGEMSVVGPRPEVARYIELYPERWAYVHKVKPGISDPASIKFRNEEELLAAAADPEKEYKEHILPMKLDLYEEYVRELSFINDVKIIVKTLSVVIFK